jgi:uncharacterized damage-inducible protein DinB
MNPGGGIVIDLQELRRLFAYDRWANRETLASLAAAGEPPARALRFMAHIVATDRLWLGRLLADGERVVVWPEMTLAECAARLDDMARRWEEYLGGLGEADLARPVEYVNSLGEAWTSTAGDILTHAVMHGVYHRGQIAAELRQAGHEPAYTDFIHAVRRGLVE